MCAIVFYQIFLMLVLVYESDKQEMSSLVLMSDTCESFGSIVGGARLGETIDLELPQLLKRMIYRIS